MVVSSRYTRYSTNDLAVEYSLHQERVRQATKLYRTYLQYKDAAKATVVAAERLSRKTRNVGYWEYLWSERRNSSVYYPHVNSIPLCATDDLNLLFSSVTVLNDLRDQARLVLNHYLDGLPNKAEVMQEVVASLD